MQKNKYKGFFITFEGPDGSGKSTQIKLLYKKLQELNIPCIITREPGGTELGEKMRDILKDPLLNGKLSIQTEALLLQTARAQHVYELIMPALKDGKIVLCDRYSDSSTAYQGIARGLGKEIIENLNSFATSDLKPDLTIVLDLCPDEGLKRADERDPNEPKDRWEEQESEFHHKVRNAFIELAEIEPSRYAVIPARSSIEDISIRVLEKVKNELGIL
jgi:dTMP kinase